MYFKLAYVLVVLCSRYKLVASAKTGRGTRIVGGEATTIDEIGNYLVALRDNLGFFCGGSYVQKKIVVTAAHCLVDRMDILDEVTVEGGVTFIDKAKRSPVLVSRAEMHPKYDPDSNDNDVAVIKLKEPLLGKHIKTIKLCSKAYASGTMAKVSGWGFDSVKASKPMKQVRTVKVPLIARKSCSKAYSDVNDITKAMLCAGVLGKKDACTYDSGGPLVISGELCGVVSYGVGCADKVYPGVYADVVYLLPFIKKTIAKFTKN